MRSSFARIGAWCVERPAPVIALAVLLTIVGAVGALSLRPDASTDSLVDSGSKTFQATEAFKAKFGDDAVAILVRDDLRRLLLTGNIETLLGLERCLAGTAGQAPTAGPAPAGQQGAAQAGVPAVCEQIASLNPSRAVYGPASFLDQFATQAGSILSGQAQAAQAKAQAAARKAYREALKQGASKADATAAASTAGGRILKQLEDQLIGIAVRYGQTGLPKLSDPTYVSSVVFDTTKGAGEPKSKFSYLFPSPKAALISVRMRPELSEPERRRAIELFRDAVSDPAFQIRGADYVVSGVPVVVEGLSSELQSAIFILLLAALIVMAATLALVFGPPLRLLPLGVALAASSMAFGVLALTGGSLTMASIAVLPVLIGLAVDYAIQFHARFAEASEEGSSPARAAVRAAAAGGPVIATAGLATAAGFAVLWLSPIPMVRSFGLLLVLGIVLAFLLALTVALPVLSMTAGARRERHEIARVGPGEPRRRAAVMASRSRLAGLQRRTRARASTLGRNALALSISSPGRVIAVAAVLAVLGWGLGTQTEVVSDIRQLVPSSLPELRDVDVLESETGVSGEIDVTVTAGDITSPDVITWMGEYEQRVLALGGFDRATDSCRTSDARLCPSISLPDLFAARGVPDQRMIRRTLSLLPPPIAQAVVETDQKTGELGNTAVIAFGIKVMPFDEQKRLIDGIRAAIDPPGDSNGPPAGVDAQLVGLPVLAADANAALSGNRYLLSVIGLLAVALALLAVYRSARRALVPLIPIVFATGWSSLVLWLVGVPLNPMSATLGALVIAIATEFSVLLSARYEEERDGGRSLGEALRRAYSRTGAAVLASGVTAIAGFAALTATDIRMLRDFGVVTVLDLGVALLGVLLVLPAALVWADAGFAPFPATFARLRRRGGASPAAG